jgi:glycosyltransferase involved in cell wall biosynthesis
LSIIRVSIQQPAIPKYRLPLFKSLAKQKNINLKLFYSIIDITIPNVVPIGINSFFSEMLKFRIIGKQTMLWHQAQWKIASNSVSDVIILTWDLHYLSLLPALFRAKLNKVPVILWGHGFSKNENKFKLILRKMVAFYSSAIILYDFNTAKSYINNGFNKKKIFVAPNSLDQTPIIEAKKYWSTKLKKLRKFQSIYNLNPSKTIIYIGRVYPKNNLKILILALPKITKVIKNIKLIVIGSGKEIGELKALSKEYKVDKHIIWVGELYKETEIAKWMLSSSVFCYPENIGLSIMHAFGYGLPVVTSNLTRKHNPEIYSLRNKKNGLTYTNGSVNSLVKTLKTMLNKNKQRVCLSDEALITVESKFNIKKMTSGFIDAIDYAKSSL